MWYVTMCSAQCDIPHLPASKSRQCKHCPERATVLSGYGRSSFHSRSKRTSHKVALEDKEENEHGKNIKHRAGQQQVIFRVMGAFEEKESQRESIHILCAQRDQRPLEIIPGALEGQDSHDGEGRLD